MKRALLFAVFAASAFAAAAAAESVPLDLYIGGRVVKQTVKEEGFFLFTSPAETTRYTYQWPGVWFEAAFTGGSIDAKIDDDQNNLYLWVDGIHKLTLTRPGKTTVSLKDLGPGRHIVRLEKASETQSSTAVFEGFFVPSRDDALPAPVYARRIEFIGDSHTVGYGNASRGRECTVEDVADTTDTSLAFAPLVAKHFGAAYRIHAYSGRGIVRNYNGLAPGDTLPVLYQYTLFDHSVAAPDDGWTPDVIVISLGTNDFSTELNPGEKWTTREALHADYERTYVDFLKSLRAKYPLAHIVMLASMEVAAEISDEAKAAYELATEEEIGNIELTLFRGLDWQACHYHPSLKDDSAIGALLIGRISRLPDFAPGS